MDTDKITSIFDGPDPWVGRKPDAPPVNMRPTPTAAPPAPPKNNTTGGKPDGK